MSEAHFKSAQTLNISLDTEFYSRNRCIATSMFKRNHGFRFFCDLGAELAANQPMIERVYDKLSPFDWRKEQNQNKLRNEEVAMQRFSL
ncbi:hypothetical protein AC249_AIPGENE17112 [Exaiptasia diaphana]|nr:hypothetical protein AC249_AIPGENE17112 [Exaiptasia diaphana]